MIYNFKTLIEHIPSQAKKKQTYSVTNYETQTPGSLNEAIAHAHTQR